MKKLKYLSIVPLLAIVATTSSCSMPLVGSSDNLDNVKSSIEKVMQYDYLKDIKSVSYYTIEEKREKFDVPQAIVDKYPDATITNIGFRDVRRERVTRIDFSDPNDLYFYDYSTYEFKYIYAFNKDSAQIAAESNSYSLGTQFYKKDGKYYFEYSGTKGIASYKSLHLDKYPYLNSADLASLEETVKNGGALSIADGTSLFNNYLVKIAEHDYRINPSMVDKYESDKTGSYSYTSDGVSKFNISENKKLAFKYHDANVITNDDGTTAYDSFSAQVLYPEYIFKFAIDDNFNLDYTQALSVKNVSWINTTLKDAPEQQRSVNLNYTKGGWLESGNISDNRTSFNTYALNEGASEIVFNYYINAQFDLTLPHVYGK